MITQERRDALMRKTIELSKKTVLKEGDFSPKVGAILTNSDGEILLEGYRDETVPGQHCECTLIERAKNECIELKGAVLFVTHEPCVSGTDRKKQGAHKIVAAGIKEVYIGTLNPNPLLSEKGETHLKKNKILVQRYSDEFVEAIKENNKEFFELFREPRLPEESLFISKNIPQMVLEYLQKNGYNIDTNLPDNWNIDFDYIAAYCGTADGEREEINKVLNEALGYAYDKKYASRDYKGDVRGEYTQWIVEFNGILKELNIDSLNYLHTLVVGIGNGHEGQYLYSDIDDLTIVDIAPQSLERAKELLKPKHAYVMNAQKLNKIKNCCIEAYISLMTYQSTYFNIEQALTEAYRVLKADGIIILSVACGFMKEKHVYIDGLINPQTGLVDRNRPYDLIDIIRKKLIDFNFVSVGIRTTPSEIFIYARKSY